MVLIPPSILKNFMNSEPSAFHGNQSHAPHLLKGLVLGLKDKDTNGFDAGITI